MSEPAYQPSADQWPYDPDYPGPQAAPIAGEPWTDEVFEKLWQQVDANNGAALRAIAAVEAAAA
jgi:hypothetical protein